MDDGPVQRLQPQSCVTSLGGQLTGTTGDRSHGGAQNKIVNNVVNYVTPSMAAKGVPADHPMT